MRVPQRFRSQFIILPLLALAMGLLINCSDDDPLAPDEIRSSRSYQGHASDTDINNFVKANPHTVGTRLDDCQTCHKGGEVTSDRGPVTANPCDYCHFVIHPPAGWTGLPTSFAETLNPYGTAYDDAGRDGAALAAIDGLDSDGDGFDNDEEIDDLRYPGDAGSYPGLELCATVKVTMADLLEMPIPYAVRAGKHDEAAVRLLRDIYRGQDRRPAFRSRGRPDRRDERRYPRSRRICPLVHDRADHAGVSRSPVLGRVRRRCPRHRLRLCRVSPRNIRPR